MKNFRFFLKKKRVELIVGYLLLLIVNLSCDLNDKNTETKKNKKQQIKGQKQESKCIIKKTTEKEFLEALKMYHNPFIEDTTLNSIKTNGILNLPLKNKKINLKDFPIAKYESEGKEYQLVGEILNPNKYVVKVSYWEGIDYLLINKLNGDMDTIWSIPYISPDNKRILTMSQQWGMDGVPNGIKMFFNKESLVEEFAIIQETWVPREVAWKNNQTVIIKMTPVTKYFDNTGSTVENWNKPGSGEMFEGGGTQLFNTNAKYEIISQ